VVVSERPAIPARGRDHEELLRQMEAMKAGDAGWKAGRVWSLVYYAGEAHHELLKRAHHLFFAENALNPVAFKSLKRMEAEVVQMTAGMLHAPPTGVGTMTTGGTESILMAVKAARERARRSRPWVRRPEIVAPRTAHVAFGKAAHYFGMKIRYAEVGEDFRVDVGEVRRLIGRNTALIVASAPQYPHGVIDPIAEIGALAEERGIPLHVDACVGGFMLPWVERLGYPVPPFDFRVPGVTSMSADAHKYGFAAKGASVVVYRDMSYLRHQFFISTDWPGGIYISPSMTGTRGGGPIAAAWASLMALGEEGFLDHTRRAMEAATRLREGIGQIPGLEVLGAPAGTIITYGASDPAIDPYRLADLLEKKGWSVDRQQHPASIHCTVTSNHGAVVGEYLADLREAVEHVRAHPGEASSGSAAMYGMMAKIPFRGLVKRSVGKVMEAMYGPSVEPLSPEQLNGAEEGLVGQLLERHGPRLNALLDQVDGARARLRRRAR
jgi:glutamate/tyrosine decarboxylase-like PLP-dependent enzyme